MPSSRPDIRIADDIADSIEEQEKAVRSAVIKYIGDHLDEVAAAIKKDGFALIPPLQPGPFIPRTEQMEVRYWHETATGHPMLTLKSILKPVKYVSIEEFYFG